MLAVQEYKIGQLAEALPTSLPGLDFEKVQMTCRVLINTFGPLSTSSFALLFCFFSPHGKATQKAQCTMETKSRQRTISLRIFKESFGCDQGIGKKSIKIVTENENADIGEMVKYSLNPLLRMDEINLAEYDNVVCIVLAFLVEDFWFWRSASFGSFGFLLLSFYNQWVGCYQ